MTNTSTFQFTLRKAGPALFVVTFLGIQLDSWVSSKMHENLSNPDGATAWVWLFALLSVSLALLIPSLNMAIFGKSVKHLKAGRPQKFNWAEFQQLVIELMRAYGKSFLWSLLLIVPGIVKWLRLSLVPWIVIFLPAYDRGEVDALLMSEKLTKGIILRIVGIYFLFSLLIPLLMTSFDEYKVFWDTPVMSVLLAAAETLFTLAFLTWFYKIFEQKAKGSL